MAPLTTTLGTPLGPDFTLTLDGKNISGQVRPRLLSLTATLNRGITADSIIMVLDDTDGKLELPVRGKTLLASVGWQGQPLALLGSFIVDTVEHSGAPDKVTVKASSADFRHSLDNKAEHSYPENNVDQTTLGDITRTIAARHGLKAAVHPDLEHLAVIKQHQAKEVSDMSFLSTLALSCGAVADIKYGTLLLLKPGTGTNASGKPLPPAIIARKQGDLHKFTITDRGHFSGVQAKWLDLKAAEIKTLPPIPVPVSAATADQYVRQSGEKKVDLLPHLFPDEASARLAAQARVESLQRLSATMEIVLASGREDLVPETPVTLAGFKSQFNEVSWIITKVDHIVDMKGFITKIALETAP